MLQERDETSNHYRDGATKRQADNRMGALAEFGAAAFYGVPAPTDVRGERYDQDIGQRTDVKAIANPAFRLVIPMGRVLAGRVYLLALVESQSVYLQGFRLGRWILERRGLFWVATGLQDGRPCWAIDQEHLLPADGLTAEEI